MKKSKKIIVYLCLFFLSFFIVTDFKRQETQAIALVDDALLWAFGMLVLGTGVVAIKDIQVPHMGSLVLDNLKSSGVSEEEFLIKSADGVLKGIKIYDKVLNAVDSVSLNLPVKDYDYFDSISSNNVDSYKVTIGSFPVVKSRPSSLESENLSDLGAFVGSFSYTEKSSYYFNGVLAERLDNPPGEVMFFGCSYNNVNYIGRVYYNTSYKKYMYSSTKSYTGSAEFQFNGNSLLNTGTYTNIPYSLPQIKQGYNPTYTDQNLPYTAEKPGFIPLPTDTIIDKPISTELPLTWDDVKGGVTDLPIEGDVPGEDTGEGEEVSSGWGWLLDILKSILNAILSIPGAILDFFEIDWTLVGEHVVYDEIFKTKFKPFYDVIYLLQNINVNPSTHSGKFYMVIPPEMGGDGQEHCVLDLTVGNEYIVMARAFINASIWIGFLWYIIKLFSPNLDIG